MIATQNVKHFRQAFESKAYRDKIYEKIKCDEVRDRILSGELEIEECDDIDVYSFLQLLKKQGEENEGTNSSEISEIE